MNSKKRKKTANTQQKIRKAASNVIMICLVAIFVFSAYNVITIFTTYKANQGAYDKITEEVLPKNKGFSGDINFTSLEKTNPDTVAWLYYEGSQINYPVVQGEDNDKYLHTMFDGSPSSFGTLFVDADTDKPFKQFNTIIYGHHMKNGSMFATLKDLRDQAYVEEHPQLELITPEAKYHLIICAFLNKPSDSEIYRNNISSEDSKNDYISLIKSQASYITDEEMTADDKLVILSTCAYEYKNARYIAICKMVPWE